MKVYYINYMNQHNYNKLMNVNNNDYGIINIFYYIYNFMYSFSEYCVEHNIII